MPPTAPNEYYIHDLLELPVFERHPGGKPEDDVQIGKLEDVVSGDRDIWVILGESGEERYLMASPESVLEVDLSGGRLVVAAGAAEAAE
jgi:ribosomal 30S subunit maturation factor RimM